MDDSAVLVDAVLPNGAVVKVAAVDGSDGAQDVGFTDLFQFDQIQHVLSGVADMIRGAVEGAALNTIEVEFGLGTTVEGGKLIGLITKASGTASFTVRLGLGPSNMRTRDTPDTGGPTASR